MLGRRWLAAAIIGWREVLRRVDATLLPRSAALGEVTNFDYRRVVLLIAGLALGIFIPSLFAAHVPSELWVSVTVLSALTAVVVSTTLLLVPAASRWTLFTPMANGVMLSVVGVILRPYYHSLDLLIPLVVAGHAILHGLGPGLVSVAVGTLVVVYAFHDPAMANASEVAYSAIYLTGAALLPWATFRLAERRAAEVAHARRQSETRRARLEAVLRGMVDALVVVDRDGRELLTNPAYEGLVGAMGGRLEPLDRSGRRIARKLLPLARASRGETFDLTFVARLPTGERRWYEASGAPIGSAGQGNEVGLVVIRDMTDRSLRREQEEFMATASHELRTPIAALHGYMQLLERKLDPQIQPREAEYARAALTQTRRLGHLLDRLFDLAHLQTGRLDLTIQRVDLLEVVRSAGSTLAPLAHGRQINLNLGMDNIVVLADAGRLEQVLVNLISNALQHAPQNPRIDVEVGVSGSRAWVSVRDYGPGIPKRRRPRLLRRTTGRHTGLGLGLYISRELMRAQRGSLEVSSEPGVGTTATLFVPRARRQ
jgi:PAS domain S-box-containing protein